MDHLQHLASCSSRRNERGVALILVVFIVSLATILVVNLAYSTYIGSRLNVAAQRSLQAEYLLKSALNLAMVLIQADVTPEDSPDDLWQFFKSGVAIPPEWIGLTEPNVSVQLEVRPEGCKIPLRQLVPSQGTPDLRWRRVLTQLFKDELKFDDDNEKDPTGLCPSDHCGSEQMVANLIDYMDTDSESYDDGPYRGIEKDLPKGYFPNQSLQRTEELASIPGFTPARVQKLLPLVSANRVVSVNINCAPELVVRALHPNLSDQNVQDILAFRQDAERGPFRGGGLSSQLQELSIDADVANDIVLLIQAQSDLFQVVSKVEYATSVYFLRAILQKDSAPGVLPKVVSLELF